MPLIIIEEKEYLTAAEAKAIAENWRHNKLQDWMSKVLAEIALEASKGKLSTIIFFDRDLTETSVEALKSLGYKVGPLSPNSNAWVYWD